MTSSSGKTLIADPDIFTGSEESILVAEELERRRRLVDECKSRLISEEGSWSFLRSSGCHV